MDKYDELKHNFKFLKKTYDLVKEDFPKLFRNSSDYTEEDEKNWDIALKKIDDNFITPEEQDFIEIWGDTDGTIGLIDYVYQNKNQFESFKESTNKYISAFRKAVEKLQESIEKTYKENIDLEETNYSSNRLRHRVNTSGLTRQEKNIINDELKNEFKEYGIYNYNFMTRIVNDSNTEILENDANLIDANNGNWNNRNLIRLASRILDDFRYFHFTNDFHKLKDALQLKDSDTIAMIKILYKFNPVYGFNGNI